MRIDILPKKREINWESIFELLKSFSRNKQLLIEINTKVEQKK